jgi:hypothetical protein
MAMTSLFSLSCRDEYGGGPRTVSRSGYRAVLAFSAEERYEIAARGPMQRVSGEFDGSELVKVVRPDLGKVWQYRPGTRKVLEQPWSPTEEIVPGYPLEPRFEPAAYAARFGGKIERIDDATHGMHPCERYQMTLPSGDKVVIWVARDLERLVVRIEHAKAAGDDVQPFTDTKLLDVRVGAPRKLFELPKGYERVSSYEALSRK